MIIYLLYLCSTYLPMLKVKDEMTIKFYNVSKHVKQQNKLEQWPRGIKYILNNRTNITGAGAKYLVEWPEPGDV